jgi:glycosyltransferase involved in cell wall biosynthesis
MRICLVTTFPPSQAGLSEYGLHIAQELRRNPLLSVTILADRLSSPQPELEGFNVERCWSFDDASSSARLLATVARLKPDVVWFNLLFSTFGRNPLIAFMGLFTPVLTRLSGRYTHVTLHHLMDTVDLKDAGIRHPRAYQAAGAVATKILLLSNSVSVLMPRYRKILSEKYGRDNVHVRSHGVLTQRPEYPDFEKRGNPFHRILAFGKWGTYKRLELMIESFKIVAAKLPNATLVVAGGDHPQAAGYVDSMKAKCADDPRIEFTGYVHEDQLPSLFQSSSVAVMPYSSSTGCSGVAHLACAYGVPIICADLPDFRQMGENEELAIEFYKPGDAEDLAACLIDFLADSEKQQAMAVQNFSTALRMTMPTIVLKYLRHFELDQKADALRRISRVRRLPTWLPFKGKILRMMNRNSPGWVHRSAAPRALNRAAKRLSDSNVDSSGELAGAVIPLNGYHVIGNYGRDASNGNSHGGNGLDGTPRGESISAAGKSAHTNDHQKEQSDSLKAALTGQAASESKARESDGQQPA